MTPESFHRIKDQYEALEILLHDRCLDLPFHLDGPDYDEYCRRNLRPFKLELLDRMQAAADAEDFEQALAIQRFVRDRLLAY